MEEEDGAEIIVETAEGSKHKGFCGTMGYINESELTFVPARWMYKYNRSKYWQNMSEYQHNNELVRGC